MTELQRRAANYERQVFDKVTGVLDVLNHLAREGRLTAAEIDLIAGPMMEVATEFMAIMTAAIKRLDVEATGIMVTPIPGAWWGPMMDGL